MTVLLIT